MVAATQINGFLIVSFSLTGFSREESLLLFFVVFAFCVRGKLPQQQKEGRQACGKENPLFRGPALRLWKVQFIMRIFLLFPGMFFKRVSKSGSA